VLVGVDEFATGFIFFPSGEGRNFLRKQSTNVFLVVGVTVDS
jgi:hypothetical protein